MPRQQTLAPLFRPPTKKRSSGSNNTRNLNNHRPRSHQTTLSFKKVNRTTSKSRSRFDASQPAIITIDDEIQDSGDDDDDDMKVSLSALAQKRPSSQSQSSQQSVLPLPLPSTPSQHINKRPPPTTSGPANQEPKRSRSVSSSQSLSSNSCSSNRTTSSGRIASSTKPARLVQPKLFDSKKDKSSDNLKSQIDAATFLAQANVPSLQRRISQSAMEYTPPTSQRANMSSFRWFTHQKPTTIASTTRTTGLLHRLVQRSSSGHPLPRNLRPPKRWKSPKWVHLNLRPGAAAENGPVTSGSTTAASSLEGVKVEHLAWDSMDGVLLAVALSNKRILIFDWDMVRAADRQGKSEWQRAQQQQQQQNSEFRQALTSSSFSIPPILEFRVPHAISKLEWNPQQPDELAVGFKATGLCHLYQLDRVSAWLSSRASWPQAQTSTWGSSSSNSNSPYPPPRTYICLGGRTLVSNDDAPGGKTVKSILYLGDEHILVSAGSMVYCWRLQKDTDLEESTAASNAAPPLSTPLLKWRYKPPSPCTCAVLLSGQSLATCRTSLVLLGTRAGNFCLLNWAQTMKERSFSTERKPKVLQEWVPTRNVAAGLSIDGVDMGIVQCKVCSQNTVRTRYSHPSGQSPNSSLEITGIQISWVTRSGWLLSTTLQSAKKNLGTNSTQRSTPSIDISVRSTPVRVLYAPAKVEYRDADGKPLVDNPRRKPRKALGTVQGRNSANPPSRYSLPTSEVTPDLSTEWILWPETPGIIQHLGRSDKYVVDTLPKTTRKTDKKPALLCMHSLQASIEELQTRESSPLVASMKSSASKATKIIARHNHSALALHPGSEWLVMASKGRITLLVGRG